MPSPMDSGWAPMLCIDCGGVLTRYGDVKYDGEEIYKATMPGAWAFLLLWQACYGEDAVRIISKVKWFPHKEKHWVVRHAMSLGLSSDQVFLTDQNSNKGYYARRSNGTVVVDDRLDCLQSMMNGSSKSLQTAVLFGGADPRNEKKVHCISDFRDLAVLLEVYPNGTVWDWLMDEGPPNKPHDEAVRDDLLQRLKAMDDARAWLPTSTANKRKVEAASALSSSNWVPKGSAAPAGDNDDDDERPPPPDNVVFLYRKSAAKNQSRRNRRRRRRDRQSNPQSKKSRTTAATRPTTTTTTMTMNRKAVQRRTRRRTQKARPKNFDEVPPKNPAAGGEALPLMPRSKTCKIR